MAHLVDRAVNLTPNSGSSIRLEKKTLIGVANIAAFSVKNGRFSGRKTSKRWFTSICGSFDSISLKSGLTAASIVTAFFTTTFVSNPARL